MIALVVALWLQHGVTMWTSQRIPNAPEQLINGLFSSCPDGNDGAYGERVMVYRSRGKAIAEIHFGPRQEFAIFADEVPEERDHRSIQNLLGPAYQYDDVPSLTGRNWSIASLVWHISIVRAPGSDESCYAHYVLIISTPRTLAAR